VFGTDLSEWNRKEEHDLFYVSHIRCFFEENQGMSRAAAQRRCRIGILRETH
jgi:hypothetical protein